MRLEDALLYAVLSGDISQSDDPLGVCSAAVSAGADVLQARAGSGGAEIMRGIRELCSTENSVLVVEDDSALALECGADGVCLTDGAEGAQLARAVMGNGAVVGAVVRSIMEAALALETGVDYLVYDGGTGCAEAFAALRDRATVPFYAAGFRDTAGIAELIKRGMCRICVDVGIENPASVRERLETVSGLLGRVL